MSSFRIRPIEDADRRWVARFLEQRWGSSRIVTRGVIHQAHELPGFMAVQQGEAVGLVTLRIEEGRCEIVSLDRLNTGCGIGTALIEAVKDRAPGQLRGWALRPPAFAAYGFPIS